MSNLAGISYAPPPTVADFIREYSPGELFFDWIIGPVGSGKTTGIFFKLAYMASLQAPSPRDGIRRSRAVIVRNTMPQLRDTTITSWNYWFKEPASGMWRGQNTSNAVFLMKFNDVECEVLFRPLDTPDDVARVLSLEVTFAIIDEFVQIDKAIIEALSARCGRYPPAIDGGATNWGMWGSSNPGNEDSWWHDKLEDALPSNWVYFKQPSGFSRDAENLDNLPGRQNYYHSLAEGKSEHWVKQFIETQWGWSLDGTPVLKTFAPHIHVGKRPLPYNPHLPLIAGFDPGMSSAMVFGQMDFDGRLLILSELVQDGYGAQRFISERLKPHLRLRYPNLRELIVTPDPAAFSRSQSDERSVVDMFKKAGYHVEVPDMNNTLAPRIAAMEHFTTRLVMGQPAMLIDPSCKAVTRALSTGWRYKVKKDEERAPEPEKNSHSHPADATGYLCKYCAHQHPSYAGARSKVTLPLSAAPRNYHMR